MTDLMERTLGMIRRDRHFYFRCCAWCDKPAGVCDHSRELLAQARARIRELRRPLFHGWRPYAGPWVHPRPADVGLLDEALPPALFRRLRFAAPTFPKQDPAAA